MTDYAEKWLVDSSRIKAGHHCRMLRYLGYHAGPYGYGLQKKSLSIPLVTGIHVHAALATILTEAQKTGEVPSAEFQKLAVSVEAEKYKAAVASRNLESPGGVGLNAGSDVGPDLRLQEQTKLLAGLVYGYCRITLPLLLEEFDILKVEQEQDQEVGSTTLQMTRPDALLRDKVTGEAVLLDFKTASSASENYVEQWRNSIQMMAGARGASLLLKEPVKRFYIHVLLKGAKKHDYNAESGEYDGPERQQSMLVWPYFREGTPPMVPDEWQPFWKYACADPSNCSRARGHARGNPHNHTLGQGWERRLHPDPWAWVQSLGKGELATAFQILGPYEVNDYKVEQYFRGLEADEIWWNQQVRAAGDSEESHGWANEVHQGNLDALFPRSYECDNLYGAPCPMKTLCFKYPGWEDPIGSGLYMPRKPHHAQEELQMKALGIPIPDDAGNIETD